MERVIGLLYRAAALATSARALVVGWSMYPTLADGEYVLFDRLAFKRQRPNRGDVVLVRGILTGNRAMIKRVVGVHGDTVRLIQGAVTVNDTPLENIPSQENVVAGENGLWTLGQDEYFLLGDATAMSTDSRSFGPIPRSTIKARAWLVYWPMNRWRRLDIG